MNYAEFLQRKSQLGTLDGFKPVWMPTLFLFDCGMIFRMIVVLLTQTICLQEKSERNLSAVNAELKCSGSPARRLNLKKSTAQKLASVGQSVTAQTWFAFGVTQNSIVDSVSKILENVSINFAPVNATENGALSIAAGIPI